MAKKEAPLAIRRKIRDLAKAGKLVAAGDLSKINLADPDFTVTKAELDYAWHQQQAGGPSNGFTIKWETASAGFGEVMIYTNNGKLYCDNETMSKFFILAVLYKLLDTAELTEPSRFEPKRKKARRKVEGKPPHRRRG